MRETLFDMFTSERIVKKLVCPPLRRHANFLSISIRVKLLILPVDLRSNTQLGSQTFTLRRDGMQQGSRIVPFLQGEELRKQRPRVGPQP